MDAFRVSAADWYSTYSPDRARCETAINELIARFGLADACVLSIGAGSADEEFWLVQAGAALTVVDIDEHAALRPRLDELAAKGGGNSGTNIAYVIGDAARWARETALEPEFDVCYFSGFTVDEMHRAAIQQGARTFSWKLRHAFRSRMGLHIGSAEVWPAEADPFSPLVMDIADRSLNEGGLFLSQSYYCGVDIPENPSFVAAARRQLRTIGVELIELYHFEPHHTDVSLLIGWRGAPDAAKDYVRSLEARPQLNTFHGRSTVHRRIRRIVP